MKTNKWLNHQFYSCSVKTEEFKAFVRDFRSDMKRMLKSTDWTIAKFNVGHFYICGFLYNAKIQKYLYFSISDVRFSPNEWHNNVLIRNAKNTDDYSGGRNCYISFSKFSELDWLFENGKIQ